MVARIVGGLVALLAGIGLMVWGVHDLLRAQQIHDRIHRLNLPINLYTPGWMINMWGYPGRRTRSLYTVASIRVTAVCNLVVGLLLIGIGIVQVLLFIVH